MWCVCYGGKKVMLSKFSCCPIFEFYFSEVKLYIYIYVYIFVCFCVCMSVCGNNIACTTV